MQGPCRGKDCDFWARVRLGKSTVDELVQQGVRDIVQCRDGQESLDSAVDLYWRSLGLKSLERLRVEEPKLFGKVGEVTRELRARLKLCMV